MINTIQPREYFPITRLLIDPLDSATYYLRAVIKNAKTGSTIDTVSLPQISGRYYGTTWQTPADSTGRGLFLLITVEVYTDSGFTTRAENYYDEVQMYLVYDRFNFVQGLATQISALIGPVGGEDIDYKKLEKILRKCLKDGIKFPEQKASDLKPVLTAIAAVDRKVDKIPTEKVEQKEADLKPVLTALESGLKALGEAVAKIPTEKANLDLAPALEAFKELRDILEVKGNLESLDDLLKLPATLAEIAEKIDETMPGVKAQLESVEGSVKDFVFAIAQASGKAPEKKQEKPGPVLTRGGRVREPLKP